MSNNTIEEIIVDKFNEHYADKFKDIQSVANKMNKAKGWRARFKILKNLLRTLPETEFTLLKGIYRGSFLVYYTVSNRFSVRTVDFVLNTLYTFVNGKYTLIDFKDNIFNGENIFDKENIYLILHLKKLQDENIQEQNLNLKEELFNTQKENSFIFKEDSFIFKEDDFIISDESEPIILDDDLSEEEIKEILKDFK